jgi:hypothetical protein
MTRLLLPGRLPLIRCRVCGVETAHPHTHICVEPERGPLLDLRRGGPVAQREDAEP